MIIIVLFIQLIFFSNLIFAQEVNDISNSNEIQIITNSGISIVDNEIMNNKFLVNLINKKITDTKKVEIINSNRKELEMNNIVLIEKNKYLNPFLKWTNESIISNINRFINNRFTNMVNESILIPAIKQKENTNQNVSRNVVNEEELKKKIGQMLMTGFIGRNPNDYEVRIIRDMAVKGEVSGVIFFSYNLKEYNQITNLTQSFLSLNLDYPLFLAIDQEGGFVQRLSARQGFKNYPSQKDIAERYNPEEAFYVYSDMADLLKSCGFNLNFSPVVDLNINPNSPAIGRIGRSFSRDPEKVFEYASSAVKAYQSRNIISVLKHFPGHGSAENDSHFGFTDVTRTWTPDELEPYRSLILSNLADMIMAAHVFNESLDRNFPATMSHRHIEVALRKILNYDGVVITDDMLMGAITNHYSFDEAVIRTINAGADILLFGSLDIKNGNIIKKTENIILQAVKEGKISVNRIDEAYRRIITLKNKLVTRSLAKNNIEMNK